jgi:hypothetical protein
MFSLLVSLAIAKTLPGLEGINVPDSLVVQLKYDAIGTQNYKCNATASTYILDNAVAKLLKNGKPVGDHYFLDKPDANGGRPTWKVDRDGSVLTGKLVSKTGNSTVNIPSLFVEKTSGTGSLGDHTHIVRAACKGGVAPVDKCTPEQTIKVNYECEYWFLKPMTVTSKPYAEPTKSKGYESKPKGYDTKPEAVAKPVATMGYENVISSSTETTFSLALALLALL